MDPSDCQNGAFRGKIREGGLRFIRGGDIALRGSISRRGPRPDSIMARRTLNRHELRAAVEAAEALGLNTPSEKKPRSAPTERRPKPAPSARMRVVWAVCDIGGRTVKTFEYPLKAEAEAFASDLKARGKGNHFVRSLKEAMGG